MKPRKSYNLSALRAVLSIGSPLSVEGVEFVCLDIKPDIHLSSISGGTDALRWVIPWGPIHAGEIQCRGFAMKVEAFGEDGNPVTGEQGESACTAPFPSMPVCVWDDPEGAKYHSAYFDTYPGVWPHGDYIEINDHGGVNFWELYICVPGFPEPSALCRLFKRWNGLTPRAVYVENVSPARH